MVRVGDNLLVVGIAYVFALAPWATPAEIFSSTWRPLQRSRNYSLGYIGWLTAAILYLICYAALQGLIQNDGVREPDYKELFTAVVAIAASAIYLSQVALGWKNIRTLQAWYRRLDRVLEEFGYVLSAKDTNNLDINDTVISGKWLTQDVGVPGLRPIWEVNKRNKERAGSKIPSAEKNKERAGSKIPSAEKNKERAGSKIPSAEKNRSDPLSALGLIWGPQDSVELLFRWIVPYIAQKWADNRTDDELSSENGRRHEIAKEPTHPSAEKYSSFARPSTQEAGCQGFETVRGERTTALRPQVLSDEETGVLNQRPLCLPGIPVHQKQHVLNFSEGEEGIDTKNRDGGRNWIDDFSKEIPTLQASVLNHPDLKQWRSSGFEKTRLLFATELWATANLHATEPCGYGASQDITSILDPDQWLRLEEEAITYVRNSDRSDRSTGYLRLETMYSREEILQIALSKLDILPFSKYLLSRTVDQHEVWRTRGTLAGLESVLNRIRGDLDDQTSDDLEQARRPMQIHHIEQVILMLHMWSYLEDDTAEQNLECSAEDAHAPPTTMLQQTTTKVGTESRNSKHPGKWIPSERKNRRSPSFTHAASSDLERLPEIHPAVRTLQKQLWMSDYNPVSYKACDFPNPVSGYGPLLWDSHLLLQSSLHIDNWLALYLGKRMDKPEKGHPHDFTEVPKLVRSRGLPEACYRDCSGRNPELFTAHVRLHEQCMQECLLDADPDYNHHEQFIVFIGCAMEELRSEIGRQLHPKEAQKDTDYSSFGFEEKWLFQLPTDQEDAVKFNASCQLVRFIEASQERRRLKDLSNHLSMRLIWEVQNGLRARLAGGMCREKLADGRKGVLPQGRPEAMLLCVLAFPALVVELADIVQDPSSQEGYKASSVLFQISPIDSPQHVIVNVRISLETCEASVFFGGARGRVEPATEFNWHQWMDAFEGRLKGMQKWQNDHMIEHVLLEAKSKDQGSKQSNDSKHLRQTPWEVRRSVYDFEPPLRRWDSTDDNGERSTSSQSRGNWRGSGQKANTQDDERVFYFQEWPPFRPQIASLEVMRYSAMSGLQQARHPNAPFFALKPDLSDLKVKWRSSHEGSLRKTTGSMGPSSDEIGSAIHGFNECLQMALNEGEEPENLPKPDKQLDSNEEESSQSLDFDQALTSILRLNHDLNRERPEEIRRKLQKHLGSGDKVLDSRRVKVETLISLYTSVRDYKSACVALSTECSRIEELESPSSEDTTKPLGKGTEAAIRKYKFNLQRFWTIQILEFTAEPHDTDLATIGAYSILWALSSKESKEEKLTTRLMESLLVFQFGGLARYPQGILRHKEDDSNRHHRSHLLFAVGQAIAEDSDGVAEYRRAIEFFDSAKQWKPRLAEEPDYMNVRGMMEARLGLAAVDKNLRGSDYAQAMEDNPHMRQAKGLFKRSVSPSALNNLACLRQQVWSRRDMHKSTDRACLGKVFDDLRRASDDNNTVATHNLKLMEEKYGKYQGSPSNSKKQ